MSYTDTLTRLEKDLELEYLDRDKAKAVVEEKQKSINSIRREISSVKAKISAVEREKEHRARLEANGVKTSAWSNEKIKLDSKTKAFIQSSILVDRSIDISIREVHLFYERLAIKHEFKTRDIRREIFIINKRSEGLSFREISELVGVVPNRVRQVFESSMRLLRWEALRGKKIAIKDS